MQISTNGRVIGNMAVSESCEYLVRACSSEVSSLSPQTISLSFNKIHQRFYIAEITFFSSFRHQCSPVGPINTSVGSTSEQTPALPLNQENSSTKEAFPRTSSSKTSKQGKNM